MQVPYNEEAEKWLLGFILFYDGFEEIPVFRVEWFYSQEARSIAEAIVSLAGKKVPISVDTVLVNGGLAERVDKAFLAEISDYGAKSDPRQLTYVLNVLKDYAGRRNMVRLVGKALADFQTGSAKDVGRTLREGVDESLATIEELSGESWIKQLTGGLEEIDKELSREAHCLTGFKTIDRVTGGLHGGDISIVGARPGTGKTFLGCSLFRSAGTQHRRALFLSAEMSGRQLLQRLLCQESGVEPSKIRTKSLSEGERDRLVEGARRMSRWGAECKVVRVTSIEEAEEAVRSFAKVHGGVEVVIVDYLQRLETAKQMQSREREVAYVSYRLKDLAVTYNASVVALAQLNREGQEAKEPENHHLRESDGILNDADNVWLLWRNDDDKKTHVRAKLSKTRHGEGARLMLEISEGMRFNESETISFMG